MSKYAEILSSIQQLRTDFKTHNDFLLPAIEEVITDHLTPMVEEVNNLKEKVSQLELIINNHIRKTA